MIKDQCNNCKLKDTCIENKVFDNTSCQNYIRQFDLEKHKADSNEHDDTLGSSPASPVLPVTESLGGESIQEGAELVITSDKLKQTTEIHGWLSFFLFAVVAGGLFSLVSSIATYNPAEYGGSTILALTDVVFGGLLCVVAFMTLYAFCKRKADAVFLGKTYVVAVFASNLLSLFYGDFDSLGPRGFSQVIRGLGWGIIWFSYLCVSKQVREVIPKDFRRLSSIDYWLLIALIVAPLLFLSLGISGIQKSQEEEASAFIQETVLSEGELTDGRVVFTPPTGFTCNRNEVEGLTVYNLENEGLGIVTLCSGYDSDQSASNINSYWENWEDEDAKEFSSELVTNESRMINGYTCYYKVKRYDINGDTMYWRFSILFDNASSKVCVISCYDSGIDEYFSDIIESIRFH